MDSATTECMCGVSAQEGLWNWHEHFRGLCHSVTPRKAYHGVSRCVSLERGDNEQLTSLCCPRDVMSPLLSPLLEVTAGLDASEKDTLSAVQHVSLVMTS